MPTRTPEELLSEAAKRLTAIAKSPNAFTGSADFESQARQLLIDLVKKNGGSTEAFDAQDFPDVVFGDWGVEIKYVRDDKWRTVANSVFEGHRAASVQEVFVLFAKMGGTPEVRWAPYADSIVHVRTSHRPRFEIEIGTDRPLFGPSGIPLSYAQFRALDERGKMKRLREYATSRLAPGGERLWWMGEDPDNPHTLDMSVKGYPSLKPERKRELRAEVTLLFPQVLAANGTKRKTDGYREAALYLLTYHGVLAYQVRDLFTAGSVGAKDGSRGHKYGPKAIRDIEPEMLAAAAKMENALFLEYWEKDVSPSSRIKEWLKRADKEAKDWTPSKVLFRSKSAARKHK